MSFMEGMMGGMMDSGDSGYGATVDTMTITDQRNGNGGNGVTTSPPTGESVMNGGGVEYVASHQRTTAYVNGGIPEYAPPPYTPPPGNGGVAPGNGGMPPGTVTMNGGNGGTPGPSPEMNGTTDYAPEIGSEAYGGPPKKKRNWGLIVGGGLLLALGIGGVVYAATRD